MKKKDNDKSGALYRVPPMETVAGLTVSPETDIPFGKQLRMGLYEYTIYERATEQGYAAGIAAHLDFIHKSGNCEPSMLDDIGFMRMLNALMPRGLPPHRPVVWRAHFIAGWSAVFLGLVREVPEPSGE